MTGKNKGTFAIGFVCVLLGFLLTLQFKSVLKNGAQDTLQNERAENLWEDLNDEREKTDALRGQVAQYKEELDRFREEAATTGNYASFLLEELTKAELLAGMTDVKGEGVEVTLRDGTEYIIHDGDLLMVINELRDAGAEALSLNGQRLLSTSEIRCAGSIVSVNNVRCAAPFIIKAIGNSETMYNALFLRGGVVDSLNQWKIETSVEVKKDLVIEGYAGVVDFQYAQSVGEEK